MKLLQIRFFLLLIGALALLGGCSGKPAKKVMVANASTERMTSDGPVIGSIADNGTQVWIGIPYAQPPVGDLRWRAPVPPTPRTAAFNAVRFGSACIQPADPLGGAPEHLPRGQIWGDEDCLYLNIYAPPGNPADLPVMVWIHGGGNVVGHAGFYDGSVLAEQEQVVVVTYNYRLGPLGWWHHASLSDANAADASGNYALLDGIRALEWVRQNIAAFGGNPETVTIFGESAGATNVAALVASPLAKGLFHGAIAQSGTVISGESVAAASHYRNDPVPGGDSSTNEIFLRFIMHAAKNCDAACARVHISRMTLEEQATIMRGIDPATLYGLYGDGLPALQSLPRFIRDGYVLPEQGVLQALGTEESSRVPMIFGSNKDEPKLFMAFDPRFVITAFGVPVKKRDARLYELFAEYGAHAWKLYGVDRPASRLYEAEIPVWTYRFDWDELSGLPFVDAVSLVGAGHALEIPFVFGQFSLGRITALMVNDENERGRLILSGRMMAYWAEFARNLNPSRGTDGGGTLWQPFAPDTGATFIHFDSGFSGIKMAHSKITFDALLERLAQDSRIADSAERCQILRTAFRYDDPAEMARAEKRLSCS